MQFLYLLGAVTLIIVYCGLFELGTLHFVFLKQFTTSVTIHNLHVVLL